MGFWGNPIPGWTARRWSFIQCSAEWNSLKQKIVQSCCANSGSMPLFHTTSDWRHRRRSTTRSCFSVSSLCTTLLKFAAPFHTSFQKDQFGRSLNETLYGGFLKIELKLTWINPQILYFHGIFMEFPMINHPFWGTPIDDFTRRRISWAPRGLCCSSTYATGLWGNSRIHMGHMDRCYVCGSLMFI